tara:strand:+ start:87115 stop:87651 length:537 start_codon:yes stop_codon:yes gene_type:complete
MKQLFALVITLFLVANAEAAVPTVKWHCKQQLCSVYGIDADGQQFLIDSKIPELMKESKYRFKYYGHNLGGLISYCGSPCYETQFIDFSNHEVTKGYYNVLAVQAEHQLVAYEGGNVLLVSRIFHPQHSMTVKDHVAGDSASKIGKIKFLSDKRLLLVYQSVKQSKPAKEYVDIALSN